MTEAMAMAAKKKSSRAKKKKVDARKAKIRDLASRRGDVTGGGFGGGGFSGFSAIKKTTP
jgi:hypothetical protein